MENYSETVRTSPYLFNEVIQQRKTVRQLLCDLKIEKSYIAVIVDGRKAALDQEIREGQRVIVLPAIAGGA
jgi:sulfur carrier protein ThiS